MAAVPLAHTQYVWHHWLSIALLVPVVVLVVAVIVAYLAKVVAPKYGRR